MHWEGREVENATRFLNFMRENVKTRVADEDLPFEDEIRGLATTQMETQFVSKLLSSVPSPRGWEIGEAIAECALQNDTDLNVVWPWNTVRDRRTPRASLPGADLVGFNTTTTESILLFGEVKTSSDANTPPRVMYGETGMVWQLESIESRLDIQHTLLKWLYVRCTVTGHLNLYRKAVSRYLDSEGKEYLLVGVLIRDTVPSQLDFDSIGEILATRFFKPTQIELVAWYLPVEIANLSNLLKDSI